ncbi:ethanolamine utilization protein [Desulfosporosinus orientis DSM 765]|uniref:Ethanolamine utilization protein n=1 Tax=Desulfosporosinus orientis (strain ATCC 19365 / DSM 765 / NCIMB 8382 / VKM B-1628 / Singapore I) TaxID=768706 RepID=G7WE41_DESOD|nr:ethanolamine utilization protein EutH [Desulfosporosinus orientis]AET69439.1 ethanolamine utilization protein [Desulfosporosinus orientis DSM 765]
MEIIGKIMLYVIMICCILGALASAIKEESGLGKAFEEGLQTVGTLFMPLTGLMISVPYLTRFTQKVFGELYHRIGADPAIAATTFIPSDIGGYLLAHQIAETPENWIMALVVGYMAAPVISFNIPVGLAMLDKNDHGYLALGAMSGIIAIPLGVLTTCLILFITSPAIRTAFSTIGPATYHLTFQLSSIFLNLIPLSIFCLLLALGLRYLPNKMIKGFMVYGKVLMSTLKMIVAFAIVEYYTGFFSKFLGGWGFSPLLADEQESFRAIELLGTIAMMLAGAFPMVYLIQKYLHKPLTKLGSLVGMSSVGSAGLLAASANALAMFKMIKEMPAGDKIMCIAYSVCAGYFLGDFLAYSTNFQPTLMFPILVGQFTGGLAGILVAKKIALPLAQSVGPQNFPGDDKTLSTKI